MSDLNELGEFGLIELLTRDLHKNASVTLGVGDDCAVIRAKKENLLFSCDAFLEDIHFRKEWASPEDIGFKAAAAALSDIAAMGGAAKYMLVALACPADTDSTYLKRLYTGIKTVTQAERVSIIGGDTTASPHGLVLNMTVIGSAHGSPVCRSGARPGDLIGITGHPGSAAMGLHALEHGANDVPASLLKAHLRPRPKMREGFFLGCANEVNAMIDISDGLLQDLWHIAEQSGVSVNIDSARLPLSPEQKAYALKAGISAENAALSGGEDYELAFTASPRNIDQVLTEFKLQFTLPVTVIGTVNSGPAAITVDGVPRGPEGFDHFHGLK